MVHFGGSSYLHAMDREKADELNLSTRSLGTSARMGDVLQSLKGELSAGATHVELVFSGKGKGSLQGQNVNPEMFDKVKREEIRQLAKLNDTSLSTHASVAVSGVAGFAENKFSDRAQKEALIEIKRTIDFAAATAEGGAVVVHTSEFPREVKDKRFKLGPEGQEVIYLADKNSGQIISVNKSQKLLLPQWERDKNGNYVDTNGKPIHEFHNFEDRVPIVDKSDNVQFQEVTFEDVKQDVALWNKHNPHEKPKNAEKEFLFIQHFQQLQAEEPRLYEYQREYKRMDTLSKEFKKDIDAWKVLEKETPKEKQENLRAAFEGIYQKKLQGAGIELKKDERPSEALAAFSNRIEREARKFREGYVGLQRHRKELEKTYASVDHIETVGLERSAKAFAEAGIYAYQLEKQKGLKKSLFVSPENLFAEWGYGAHPDELRDLIQASRKEMTEQLVKKGTSKNEAKKIAEDHIKATFDIAHANTLAKYFESDPKLTPDEKKKEFDKWLLGKVGELQKDNIIGHVHMSDNFGYFDEHLNIGGGNAPIREFLKVLKDKKYEGDLVIEWGAQGPDEPSGATLAAWAELARSPIYSVEGVGPRWSELETGGYFGRASSPFLSVGKYATAMGKDWQLWGYSEAPIE